MFNNIGGKIKVVAMTLCIIGIVFSVIAGFALIIADESTMLSGILLIIVGPIASWIGSFMTYGFGQLVENSDILVRQGYKCEAQEQNNQEES